MKDTIEETNQEVEFISSEDFQEMKQKLFEIEQRVQDKTSTDEEIIFAAKLIWNTNDYSDMLRTPEGLETEGHTLLETLLERADEVIKRSRLINRAFSMGLKIYVLINKRKPHRKELEKYFDLLEKTHQLSKLYNDYSHGV